jgi:hypothetical protein
MMGAIELGSDLDATITSAVNARVEAAVAAALSSDDFMSSYITAALRQTVEVPSANGYGKDKVTFLHKVVSESVRTAVGEAIRRHIKDDTDALERIVVDELRRQRELIARQLVASLTDAADKAYGIKVDLVMPGRD